jgi:hypothetical protein
LTGMLDRPRQAAGCIRDALGTLQQMSFQGAGLDRSRRVSGIADPVDGRTHRYGKNVMNRRLAEIGARSAGTVPRPSNARGGRDGEGCETANREAVSVLPEQAGTKKARADTRAAL